MKKNITLKKLTLSRITVSNLSSLSGGKLVSDPIPLPETFQRTCVTDPRICDPFPISFRDPCISDFPSCRGGCEA
ncbi:hypothetical protein [Ascidiimonas aurantiaca]|uniref:hypothetical protein n=1 Tax=Ascidiimonas aurantiaca TaxID=1685432 RepID=UPI0030EDB138